MLIHPLTLSCCFRWSKCISFKSDHPCVTITGNVFRFYFNVFQNHGWSLMFFFLKGFGCMYPWFFCALYGRHLHIYNNNGVFLYNIGSSNCAWSDRNYSVVKSHAQRWYNQTLPAGIKCLRTNKPILKTEIPIWRAVSTI